MGSSIFNKTEDEIKNIGVKDIHKNDTKKEDNIQKGKSFCNKNILKINIIFFVMLIFILQKMFGQVLINKYNRNNRELINFNKHDLNKYFPVNIFFKLESIGFTLSYDYKLVKSEFNLGFYDEKNNLISPSDLTLYNNLNIYCNIQEESYNIDSLPNIASDKYFNCIEFFKIDDNIDLGIKIQLKNKTQKINIYHFSPKLINYNSLVNYNNTIFNPLILNNEYAEIMEASDREHNNQTLKLKKSYIQYPSMSLKRDAVLIDNEWNFKNIYNHYFCYCKGDQCMNTNITLLCKFFHYVNIIDNNRNVYPKTDYLFLDFIFEDLTADDVYPVFEEMAKQKYPVHYITEKKSIYNKYCNSTKKCLTILPVVKEFNPINGNFLEKYLTIFLKLKVVVSCRGTTFNTEIFYNMEYITYIAICHGICYFKHFLYDSHRIYGHKRNDKILIPSSEYLLSIVKDHGWKNEDIIKLNLPRWEKFNDNQNQPFSDDEKGIKSRSIFIMFTWRDIKRSKKISNQYLQNILNLISNSLLNELLVKNNVTLYLSFHRLIEKKYLNKYKSFTKGKKYMKFIDQNQINECIAKTGLVITDFSSIIFDFMYRRKPFIIYIPDENDPLNQDIYTNDYFSLIESMKNKTIKFENKCSSIKEVVKKISFYIKNGFTLDRKLDEFCDSFQFKFDNSIQKFINYIEKIK